MTIALGKVVGAHGVRGQLKVVAYSGSLDALAGKEQVLLIERGRERVCRLEGVQPHRGGFLVWLGGVEGRDQAQALAGAELGIPESELPELEADEYYWHQLIGLEVVTTGGLRLGRVAEILAIGAETDVLVVRRDGKGPEVLVPATPEIVKEVALAEGRMVIEPPEGLLPESLTENLPEEGL